MEREEFFKLAKEEFGDKISVNCLTISDESLAKLNDGHDFWFSKLDIENYGEHAWLIGNDCPACGAGLNGLFGGFTWGIVHGEGYCTSCDKVAFRLYHYIVEKQRPLELFSIVGF